MIVEQRIGRIQRLASEHASVSILTIILKGTFEEYIVGRLMEKLQMASNAIGDIEALLAASGIDDDEDGADGFDEKIRQLVLAALAGKDIEKATRQAEQSIQEAKRKLESEAENINTMLGGMDGAEYVGPRAPKLPPNIRSMDAKAFTLAALKNLGAEITSHDATTWRVEKDGGKEFIRFEDGDGERRATLYAPGSPAFARLVSKMIASGIHRVEDADEDAGKQSDEMARAWVAGFGATPLGSTVEGARRCFEGKALVRVRATVAHDSYERLVECGARQGSTGRMRSARAFIS
jgi:hypothetical protein